MPPANSLVGGTFEYVGAPNVMTAAPNGNGSRPSMNGSEKTANFVALFVVLALIVIISIRLAGLQGMIAIGRG